MNVNEALELLKHNKTLKLNDRVGWFTMTNDYIHFSCPSDYPCCHDSYTIDEFLDIFNDSNFELD